PEVEYSPPTPGSSTLQVRLKNRGGGIGRVQVFVNDKEVIADARGPQTNPNDKERSIPVDLYQYRRFMVPGEENRVRVVAYNSAGYLSSRGTELGFTP